ncbi:MAG: HAMP domain-containing sensor histidine kinase [bacterium]
MWKGIKRKLYLYSFFNAVLPALVINLGIYLYVKRVLPGLMAIVLLVGFVVWLLGLFLNRIFMDKAYKILKELNRLKVDKSELEVISKELTDKNVELGEFIYSISHDLRAPVVSISGYSSILLEEYADKLDDEGKKYLRRISENTMYMEQLIHDLIDLSRAEGINFVFQDVNVSEILEVVSSHFSEEIKKKKINFVVKSKLKKICADKTKVIQIFNNLIGNAIKYIDTNKDSYIEVGGELEGDFYEFYVRDNGIGISRADQSKIFKLFYRVEGTGISGTGVGLNIVKKIVERHHGKIWIESELGQGSTFHFKLCKSICDISEKMI